MNIDFKVSFDFDYTLSEKPIQDLAKKYIALGADVYITTSRTDFVDGINYDNNDLFKIASELGIKKENITFTSYDDKYKFVKNYDLHFDDDEQEISLINSFPGKCIGVLYHPKNNIEVNF